MLFIFTVSRIKYLMSNSYFQFKQFTIHQDRCAMKVTTDACLFGAWVAERLRSTEYGDRSTESGVRSREYGAGSTEHGVGKVLDIGTGTGLLSLMLAQKMNALMDAIEIDKDAFEQGGENITGSPWKNRINIYHADATQFLSPSKYDVIISNPPFYENELKSDDVKKNRAHHDGLTFQQLFATIKKNLSTEGKFFLLLPYKRNQEAERLMHANDLTILQKILVRQSVNPGYFRMMIEGGHKQIEEKTIVNETSIWN